MDTVLPGAARVTRADVARLSGVSTAVVSYVLNDGPKPVAAATRQKVLAAVDALDYRPNRAARALSKGTSDMIGMLVGDSRNPFFAQLIFAVDRRARAKGFSLAVISMENSSRPVSAHVDDLVAQRAAGIVSVYGVGDGERSRLAALRVPTVLINQVAPQRGFASVRVDYRAGACTATRHLIGHGCRSIAFVGADEGGRLRETGWSDALREADLSAPPPYLTDFSLSGGYDAARKLVGEARRSDGVFVASDQMAMGLLSAFDEAGVRVPDDIAVASFDGTIESGYLVPTLTTVAQPVDLIAEAAIDAIVGTGADAGASADVGTEARPRAATPIPAELIVRQSCGCVPRMRGKS